MELPALTRPEFYRHYFAGRAGVPQFAVAEQNGQLLSAAGYIVASAAPHPDAWVSTWLALKGHNGVGLDLMSALPGLIGANVLACNNIRPATCALYRFLGWQAGRIPHYYRLANRDTYLLAQPSHKSILPVGGGAAGRLPLERVPDAAALVPLGMPPCSHTPKKDPWYLRRRYFYYPHYRYDVWAARENGATCAYVVTRTVPAAADGTGPEVPVLRVVDYIGENAVLPRLGTALDTLLRESGAEYMDCYCAGIPAEYWIKAGFCERRPDDGTVIPNYLNPPLRENTEYYYFTSRPENFVVFKADGDQDRPNLP